MTVGPIAFLGYNESMRRFLIITLLVCFCVLSSPAQRPRGNRGPGPVPPVGPRIVLPFPSPPSAELLKHRHEQTKKLSGQLVQLASEVDEELNQSGENILPVGTLKKLKEIEKLARKIRGRIKQ